MKPHKNCYNCSNLPGCGACRPRRFESEEDRRKFLASSSKECKDWEDKNGNFSNRF